MVLLIHHQELVNTWMVGEKFVRPRNGVSPEVFLVDGLYLAAWRQRLGHFALGITLLHHVARQQSHQFALSIHHRESAEGKALLLDKTQHVPNQLLGSGFDRLLD